jgi:hypothetical protein
VLQLPDEGRQNLRIPLIQPTKIDEMSENQGQMETKRLEGIDLFHTLMGKISGGLIQDVLPVFGNSTEDMLDPIVHQRRRRRRKEGPDDGLISRQAMLDSELIHVFPSKVGTELIPIGCLKAIGLGGKILR